MSRRRLIELADEIGVRERAAVRVLDDLLDATAFLIDEIDRGVLPFDAATTHTLVGELRNRRRLVEG